MPASHPQHPWLPHATVRSRGVSEGKNPQRTDSSSSSSQHPSLAYTGKPARSSGACPLPRAPSSNFAQLSEPTRQQRHPCTVGPRGQPPTAPSSPCPYQQRDDPQECCYRHLLLWKRTSKGFSASTLKVYNSQQERPRDYPAY